MSAALRSPRARLGVMALVPLVPNFLNLAICALSDHLVSGHTLKHLPAAASAAAILAARRRAPSRALVPAQGTT